MAELIQLSSTTHSTTGSSASGGMTAPANPTYAYDKDNNTAYGAEKYRGGSGDWGYYLYVYSIHEFIKPTSIEQIYFKLETYNIAAGNYPNGHGYQYVDIWYDGASSWTNVWSATYGVNAGRKTNTQTLTTGWENVTKIRARLDVRAGGDRDGTCGGWIFEIAADGVVNVPTRTFRLVKKLLGQMSDYNDGLVNSYTNGIYEGIVAKLDTQSFISLLWNEIGSANSDVAVWVKTGSASADFDPIDCTMSGYTITDNSHGLSNGDHVRLEGTTLPTNVVSTKIYTVSNVTTNTFDIDESSASGAGSDVTYKTWDGPHENSNGALVMADAGDYVQLLIELTSTDSSVYMPKMYSSGGFLLKLLYMRGTSDAEDSVEFIYEFGIRNFNNALADKFFRSLASLHTGDTGSYTITWTTENNSGSFVVDLQENPRRYLTFFPDTAVGAEINIKIYKNDNNDLKLRELQGTYDVFEPLV